MEVYILYNKITGRIISSGRINRIREALVKDFNNPDYSTITADIKRKKTENPDLDVVYTPNFEWFPNLPNSELHKAVNGEVVPLSEQELQDNETKIQQTNMINTRMRELAKQSLIDEGKLPVDYKE